MKKILFLQWFFLINIVNGSANDNLNKKKLINGNPVSVLMLDKKMLDDLEKNLKIALDQLYQNIEPLDVFINIQKMVPDKHLANFTCIDN